MSGFFPSSIKLCSTYYGNIFPPLTSMCAQAFSVFRARAEDIKAMESERETTLLNAAFTLVK